MKTILKVIVGSQAHGLATPESDFDYRGVFVVPTINFFKLGEKKIDNTSWIEGKDDDTSWEVGHFLHLAIKSNPTILETFLAPIAEDGPKVGTKESLFGSELRDLFPHIWSSEEVVEAFIGYGINQRKKFFDDKDKRASKYAVAYLRTLYQGYELLTTGTFTVKISETRIGNMLKFWKSLESKDILSFYAGEVIEHCLFWEKKLRNAYADNPNKKTNLEPINEFLLKVRKEFWNE